MRGMFPNSLDPIKDVSRSVDAAVQMLESMPFNVAPT
jgi:hypothetical protein